MRICIPTTGSRGDVQPYVALGVGLQAAGHSVRLATHADFAPLIRRQGLDFFPIEDGAQALHESEVGQRMLSSGSNAFTFMRHYASLREPLMQDLLWRCWLACQGADLILISSTAFFLGQAAAEKLGVPAFAAHCQPMTPTRFLANCLFPQVPAWLPLSGLYNLSSHFLVGEFFWQCLRSSVNNARRQVLSLPPFPFWGPPLRLFKHIPTLCGFSPAIVPKPPDWGANLQVTGYWFLDRPADWQPPARLVDFLDSGSAPICVGFGSMQHRHAEAVTEIVIQALNRCGQRGILLTGWGGLRGLASSDNLFVTDALPHDWLFGRAAAAVHHGGAGTTAAACRAGIPSIVVPFMADQPFWGRRVFDLGVGPPPVPCQHLTVERLAAAIRAAVSDPPIRQRAAVLGQRIQSENGVARAVAVIERSWQAALDHEPEEDAALVVLRRTGKPEPSFTIAGPARQPQAHRLARVKCKVS